MKKIRKILTIVIVAISFLACEENENVTYDGSQTGVGFTSATASAIVPTDGITVTLDVQATTVSSSTRTFNVMVDMEATTAPSPDNYSVGLITIPADSFDGTLDVTLNDSELEEMVSYDLVLKLDLADGLAVVGSETTTISFNKYLVCNDIQLVINDDTYGSERTWEVTDSTGTVIESGGPYTDLSGGQQQTANFTLPDGCYTFTIYDSYGDGQADGTIDGDYSLDCSIINHASGSGNWGASESTDFCVNP